MRHRVMNCGMVALALGAALLALPGPAVAQMAPPTAPRPAAVPVVLGSSVTGAIGQHTTDAIRQGFALASERRDDAAAVLLPALPAANVASR